MSNRTNKCFKFDIVVKENKQGGKANKYKNMDEAGLRQILRKYEVTRI